MFMKRESPNPIFYCASSSWIFNIIIPDIFNIIFSISKFAIGFPFVLPCHKYALELLNFFLHFFNFSIFQEISDSFYMQFWPQIDKMWNFYFT